MKELPNPTFALSPIALPRAWLHRRAPAFIAAPPQALDATGLAVSWARHQDDVRQAQRLRHRVFASEMGAVLRGTLPGHDIDFFDDYCEHLLVRDGLRGKVIGTYRVLTPAQARRAGRMYSDGEFDLSRLDALRPRMVELGRSCVHEDYRQGGVILALWGALAEFMARNRLDIMVGCASIPMQHPGSASGQAAASIWRQVSQCYLAPEAFQVAPRLALPVEQFDALPDFEPPALIKGYLRLGAKVLGPPAWDPDFNSADLPMMMHLADLPARYQKHFSNNPGAAQTARLRRMVTA